MNCQSATHPLEPTLLQHPQPLAEYLPAAPVRMFVQKIRAGFPSPSTDYMEAELDLNGYMVRRKESTFIFQVEGDSMTGAHIFDGDKLVVDRSIEPKHGHIIVAVVNSEYTVKRLFNLGGVVELRAENPAYRPIRCRDFEEIQVWGVVTGTLRKFLV